MSFWKPQKPKWDSDEDAKKWRDKSIEANPDIRSPKSYEEKLNQSRCKGRDNDGGGCRDEAVHHESEGQADGRSGWCLKHWLGESDDND